MDVAGSGEELWLFQTALARWGRLETPDAHMRFCQYTNKG